MGWESIAGDIIKAVVPAAVGAAGSYYGNKNAGKLNDKDKAELQLAQDKFAFEKQKYADSLARGTGGGGGGGGGGGAGLGLAKAQFEWEKKKAAYEALERALMAQQKAIQDGRINEANALQRIVQNIQAPLLR